MRGVGFGLLGILLLVIVLVIVAPLSAGASRYDTPTDAMAPVIPRGALVVVTPTPLDDIAVGDLVQDIPGRRLSGTRSGPCRAGGYGHAR